MHDEAKKYKCNKCEKVFVTQWRLRNHDRLHTNISVNKCNFLNNRKECPFEVLGCKFLHEESRECLSRDQCNVPKCQFKR